MKKLITILAVMIVLVGTVFAVDNAQIDLTVTVAEKVPTFKLATFNNTNILEEEVSDAVENNGKSTPASATFEAAVGETLADGDDVTVNFVITQVKPNNINKIKTTHKYTFSVEATNLVNQADANHYFEKGTVTNITAINNAIDAQYATITPGASLSIQYTGKTYAAAAEVNFAQFSVTWNGKETAIPGSYKGSVTLTMTTV